MEMHELAKLIRKKKGLTQEEMAELIGWGKTSYQHFEQNRIQGGTFPNPTKEKLEKLAAGLGGKLTIVF